MLDPAIAHELNDDETEEMRFVWPFWRRPEQTPPPCDWVTWLLMGGRGSGKTRAGAEWVRGLAADGIGPIALVGETITEALSVMVEGPSGIMAVTPPGERPRISGAAIHWPNGVVGTLLGANDPERFRGPQFAAAWCDEVGKWPNAEAAWDMLQFGLRLGDTPRQMATTTPRPTKLDQAAAGRTDDGSHAHDDGGQRDASCAGLSRHGGWRAIAARCWGAKNSTAS